MLVVVPQRLRRMEVSRIISAVAKEHDKSQTGTQITSIYILCHRKTHGNAKIKWVGTFKDHLSTRKIARVVL